MNTPILTLAFEESRVRTVTIQNEPWWVVNDVCQILGIKNPRKAFSRIHTDDKGVTTSDTLGGIQSVNIVSESGLYDLVFQSRRPEAATFRRWVTKEVLPSIRKNGFYSAQKTLAAHYLHTLEALVNAGLLPTNAMKVANKIVKITDDTEEIGDLIALAAALSNGGYDPDAVKRALRELPRKLAIHRFEKAQKLLD